MIKKGLYVKVIFKNNTQLEGVVEGWSDQQSVLKFEDNYLVIPSTLENVLAVKICNVPTAPLEKKKKIEKEFEEVKQSPSSDLRIQKLADLRKSLNEQEREIIKNKLVEHVPSRIGEPQYGIPSFKKPGVK